MAHKLTIRQMAKYWLLLVALITGAWAVPARAANSSGSGTQGLASGSVQTIKWIDFTEYVDATARSTSGQDITYYIGDGSTLTFTVKVTTNGGGLSATSLSQSGTAAIGTTSIYHSSGAPLVGKPVLLASNDSTVTLTFSNMKYKPLNAAGPGATSYQFIAADAQSTNAGESIDFTTNGESWTVIEQIRPFNNSTTLYPSISNTGTTFSETGVDGIIGSYVIGSVSPTTISTTITAGAGGQAVMFGVRTARIRVNHYLGSGRADPSDQIAATSLYTATGTTIKYVATSGTSTSTISAYSADVVSLVPITVSVAMVTGSSNPLTAYRTLITCGRSNNNVLSPNMLIAPSYTFPALQYGDNVTCQMYDTPYPRLRLKKALGATGRAIADDQFTMNVTQGGSTVATTTTTGTGTTVTNDTTPWYQGTTNASGVSSTFGLSEVPSGTTVTDFYTSTMSCINTNAVVTDPTPLPNTVGGTITPKLGDVVTCTITNTAKTATVTLIVTKTMAVVSDPINGINNPKLIPGAVVRYTTTVTNTGQASVDASTLVITDPLPPNMTPYVGNPAVTFTDGTVSNGTVPSGLAFDPAADTSYSSEIGGGAPFAATPSPDANGYDANIRGLRIAPTGTMAGRTVAGQPSFTVSFLAQVN